MKKDTRTNSVAKSLSNVLTTYLRSDANSASCAIFYQPKAPKEIERFRRNK